jgi:hypothetical protein
LNNNNLEDFDFKFDKKLKIKKFNLSLGYNKIEKLNKLAETIGNLEDLEELNLNIN